MHMPRHTSRRSRYTSHRPVQVSGMPAGLQPWPQPREGTVETSWAPTQPADDGELTALPWIGLHYTSEGPQLAGGQTLPGNCPSVERSTPRKTGLSSGSLEYDADAVFKGESWHE